MKKITFLKSLFVVLALSLFSFSVVAEEAILSNSFTAETMQSSVSSYTTEWKNVDATTLTLFGFNNNSKAWAYVKCGRKSDPSTATITTGKMTQKVTKVVVKVDNVLDASKVKTACLEVATDAGFTADVQKVTVTIAKGDLAYVVPTPAENCYYRLTYDCIAHGTKNGIVQISKIDFYYELTGAEVEATAITLDKTTLALEQYRETELNATLTPADAVTLVSWSSDNESVVKVANNGSVTAVGVGTATITAKAGELAATCAVTVKEATVLTCAKAAEYAASVSGNNVNYVGGQYVVKGYVTEIATAYDENYKNISVWMADTKDGGKVFELYRGKSTNETICKVGDYIEVVGYLTKYNTTPETAQGATYTVIAEPAPAITATWDIEEGDTLKSFTEATITFTGVEKATTTSMYPACFYKVAEDGTATLVKTNCSGDGVLDRIASGASVKLWVDEDAGCYEGKITSGKYRIVLSAGMVKFNNDNANKNTVDYVLNFVIENDVVVLPEVDAVYTATPANNSIVSEIREIVLQFTEYTAIAVAEPDFVNGSNIPQVYLEDELTSSMMPAGYIMFKADTLSANGLRLYVDPMYTGGEESFAREGKYVVRIPAGVVTFGTTGISKEIVLNYTVGKVQSGEVTTMVELKANEGKRVLYKGLEPAKVTIGGGWGSYTEYFMPDSVTVLNYLGNVIPAKMDVYGTYNSAYVADEWSEATPTFVVDSVVAIYAFNNMGDLVDFVENEATDEQKMASYEIKEPVVVTMASMFSFYVQYEVKNMMGRSSWQGLMVQAGRMSMYQSKAGDAIQIKGSYSPAVYDENDVMQRPAYFALETATVVSENNKLNYASIDLSYGLKYVSEYYASLGRLSKGGKIAEDDYGYYYVISYVDYVENPETNMYDEVLVTDSLKLMVAGPVDLSAYVGKDLDKLVAGVIDFDPSEGAPVFYVTELQEPKLYYNTIAELLAAGAQTDYTMSSALRNPVLLTYISHNQFAGYTIFVQDSTGAIAIKGIGEADEMGEYTAPFPYDVVAGDSIKGVEGFTTFGDAAAFMWSGDEYVSNLKLEKVSKGVVEPIDITLAEFNADVALVLDAIMMGDFYLSKYANKVVRVKGLTRTDDPEDEKWPWLVQGEDSIKVSTYYWGRIAVPYAITSLTGIADYTIINGQTASIQPLNAESVVAGSGVKVEYVTLADLYTENGLIVVDGEFQIFTITGQNVTDMNGNLPSGVYVVRTATAVGKVVVK